MDTVKAASGMAPGEVTGTVSEAEGRLLVVDDDPVTRHLLCSYFRQAGYHVAESDSGADVEAQIAAAPCDIVLLDIRMPGRNGLDITRSLRVQSSIGIILISQLADDTDRVIGLEIGADDYITKPFNLREVHARVKSLLRRMALWTRPDDSDVIRFQGWQFDLATRHLTSPQGEEVRLTGGEFQLLACLVQRPKRLTPRNHLIAMVSDGARSMSAESLDVLISRLRRKLGDDTRPPRLIVTVHGQGYVFAAPTY